MHASIATGDVPGLNPFGLAEALHNADRILSVGVYRGPYFGKLPVGAGNGGEEGNWFSVAQLARRVSFVLVLKSVCSS